MILTLEVFPGVMLLITARRAERSAYVIPVAAYVSRRAPGNWRMREDASSSARV